jgi:hypothetical protein
MIIYFGMTLRNIYIFYARAWYFREFSQNCEAFHHNVIRTLLKNYEEYGIFKNQTQMERDLQKGQLNPEIVKKIMEVREVNAQLSAASGELYESIILKQI